MWEKKWWDEEYPGGPGHVQWPEINDEDGSGQCGTVLDKAFFDQLKRYIDDAVHKERL